jgi:hypothetical protein
LSLDLLGAGFFLFERLLHCTVLLALHLLNLLLLFKNLHLVYVLALLELLEIAIDVLLDLIEQLET